MLRRQQSKDSQKLPVAVVVVSTAIDNEKTHTHSTSNQSRKEIKIGARKVNGADAEEEKGWGWQKKRQITLKISSNSECRRGKDVVFIFLTEHSRSIKLVTMSSHCQNSLLPGVEGESILNYTIKLGRRRQPFSEYKWMKLWTQWDDATGVARKEEIKEGKVGHVIHFTLENHFMDLAGKKEKKVNSWLDLFQKEWTWSSKCCVCAIFLLLFILD